MATAKEREQFIALMVAEYCPQHSMGGIVDAARALLRHSRTHGRLAVEKCNGPGDFYCPPSAPTTHAQSSMQFRDFWEDNLAKRQEHVEKRIREICAGFNLPVKLGGDPRGYTVKIKLLSGAYNTWGGSEAGYGVPQ